MRSLKTAIAAASTGPARALDPATQEQDFRFEKDFEGFSGHFPGHPLLPGFIQIMVISRLAERLVPERQIFAVVEKAKFVREIIPGQDITAQCRRISTGGRTVLEGKLSGPGGPAASMTLAFEERRKNIV
jgi:3-hydroxyacyl-[acyl-carrier-protein] dehydratase